MVCGCLFPASGATKHDLPEGSASSPRANGFSLEPPAAIPTTSTKDILAKISQAVPLLEAERSVAVVNIQSHRSADFELDTGPASTGSLGQALASGGFVRATSLKGSSSGFGLRRTMSVNRGISEEGRKEKQLMSMSSDAWQRSQEELEKAIHAEKVKDHADWNPDLQSEEQRLRKRLAKLNLDMKVMQGDGNCQFRAVSFGLYGSQQYHQSIRESAVAYMRAHKEDYEAFVGESIDSYLDKMELLGTWGDELTLRAISDYLGIVIYVVTSDQHNWFMRYKPSLVRLLQEVFLTYIAPVHYNAIRRQTVSLALRQSLGRTTSIEQMMRRACSHDLSRTSRLFPSQRSLGTASERPLHSRLPSDSAMARVEEGENEGRVSVSGTPPRGHSEGDGKPQGRDTPEHFYGRVVKGSGPHAHEGEVVVNPILVAQPPRSAFAEGLAESHQLSNGEQTLKPEQPRASLI